MATPIYGVDAKGWAKLESTFNTAQTLVATDAFAFIELTFEPSKEWTKSAEHTGSATLQTEIAGLEGGSWSATCYVKPSGTAGTAPDGGVSALLTAGMGSVDDAASYVEYNLTSAVPQTLQLAKHAGAGLYEQVTGAWVESVEVSLTGNEPPTFTFSGGFARYSFCYDGAEIASVASTTITLKDSAGDGFHNGKIGGVGLRLLCGADGTARVLNSTDYAAKTLTTAVGTTAGAGDTISVEVPDQTLAGEILGGVDNSLTIDAKSVGVISAKFTIATGYHGLDREATSERASRVAKGTRECTGELEFYYLDENAGIIGSGHFDTTREIELTMGSVAGKKVRAKAPAARLEVSAISLPEADEATVSAAFVARKDSANEDETFIGFD